MAGRVPGPGRGVRRAGLRLVARAIATFGETEAAPAPGLRGPRGARAEGLEAAGAAGARPGRHVWWPSTTRASTRSGRPPRSCDLPVLIHIADPIAFFEPLDATNERWEELHGHPDWHFWPPQPAGDADAPGFPPFDALLAAFGRLVARHPATTFVGAHVGCAAEDLALVGATARREPELLVDIAARLGELGRQPYTSRAFFLRYADRILFGVDMAPDPDLYAIHYRFLETFDESFDYDTDDVPGQGRWQIHGIGLPEDVLRKVYRDNARRILRLARVVTAAADSYRLGARRGLDACASERGTFAVLALDHRQNLRKALRPDDPASATYDEMVAFKRAVVRALAPVATGTLLDPEIGAAQCIADGSLPAASGLIVAIEATGYDGSVDGADQPRPRGLERREGEADGRVGGEAPRLLPPRGVERRRPGGARRPGRGRLPGGRSRAVRRAALVLARRRREADRRGASRGRHRDRPAADGDRRRRPQGRVPVRRVGRRPRRAGGKRAPSSTRRRACRGCCSRAASTTRRSRPRSRSPARPARAASSPADPCGRRRRRSTRRARDAFLATTGRDRLRRLAELVDGAGRPWRERPGALRIARASPARAGTGTTPGERSARSSPGDRDIDILVVGEINPDIVISDPDPVPRVRRGRAGRRLGHDDRRQLVGDLRLRRGPPRAPGRVRRRRRRRRVRPLHARRDGRARGRRLGVHRRSGASRPGPP